MKAASWASKCQAHALVECVCAEIETGKLRLRWCVTCRVEVCGHCDDIIQNDHITHIRYICLMESAAPRWHRWWGEATGHSLISEFLELV